MHAARAIQASRQREKKEEPKLKVENRRSSAVSGQSRFPRSPAVSIDTKKVHPHHEDSDNLNFSYIGFLIAVFGAVPLLVGTFVEVPALWEIGLGVTLVGLFIGVVFWCTELCAEAKKLSQKKNQLSTRGKIEDSNLLHVPQRKFHNGNGVESRRSSSVSMITPMAQSFGSPKHLHHNVTNVASKGSILQYSSEYSKSDQSASMLSASLRANGHLGLESQPPPPPPKLLLRGTRKDDSRVVSLVQPDPGLEDDSDSDAETVIEAPTGRPKIIQVQTQQEKEHRQSGVILSVSGHSLMDPDSAFHLENEKVPPLVPLAQHHRTIRMPVMPQELDKLQRCECGRYLLTDSDKLVGLKLPGIAGGGSSMPATTYNSPLLAGTAVAGAGTAPATRKHFSGGLAEIANTPDTSSTNSSINDISGISDPALSSIDDKITTASPTQSSNESGESVRQESASSTGNRKCESKAKTSIVKSTPAPYPPKSEGSALSRGESIVQVEPTINSSDLSVSGKKTECYAEDDGGENEDFVKSVISPNGNTLPNKRRLDSSSSVEDDDKLLEELLELTDIGNDSDDGSLEERSKQRSFETGDKGQQLQGNVADDDEEFVIPSKTHLQQDQEISKEQAQSRSNSRPTSLALPKNLSDSKPTTQQAVADVNYNEVGTTIVLSASSASTVVFIGEQGQNFRNANTDSEKHDLDEYQSEPSQELKQGNNGAQIGIPLATEMSLDELLDKIEQKQDGDMLTVVVQ